MRRHAYLLVLRLYLSSFIQKGLCIKHTSLLKSDNRESTANMAVPPTYNGYPLWLYYPNVGAAIAFSAMFAILTIAHLYVMFRHRMWFCIPMVVGGLCRWSFPRMHGVSVNRWRS